MNLKEFVLYHRAKLEGGQLAIVPSEKVSPNDLAFICKGRKSAIARNVPWRNVVDLVEMIAETMEFMYRRKNEEVVGFACNPDNEPSLAEALAWFSNPEPLTGVKEEDPGWTDDD